MNAEEPINEKRNDAPNTSPPRDQADPIVSSIVTTEPDGAPSSSRRQSSSTTAATPAKSTLAPELLAHKPAVAAPTNGKIVHPAYPPKHKPAASESTAASTTAESTTTATTTVADSTSAKTQSSKEPSTEKKAPAATPADLAAPTLASPTVVAPTSTEPKTTPLLTPPVAKSSNSTSNKSTTTESSAAEKAQLHNALRDAEGGHEPALRGPSVSSSSNPLAPAAGLRSPTDPQVVKPKELAPAVVTPNAVAPNKDNKDKAVTKNAESRDTRPSTVASDNGHPRSKPVRTSDPSEPGRLLPLRESDEESGDKSVIGRTPADANSRELFESQQDVPLSSELAQLKKRTQSALALYYQNWTLNTRDQSPWEVMHAIVAYGVDTRIRKGGPGGEPMTAIGHLCFSGICKNQPILTIRKGELYALRGPGVQGHSGQFLAILAQSYLQRDYPLYVGGQQFTLEDLIEAEKKDCEAGTELTFKLISLMHYLPSDATWTNFQGQEWSLDRLIREEIVQPVRGAACGGTHRLMGLSYAVRKREQREEPITGMYLEAQKYIDQYHKYTWSLQNPDGSFSTAWFVRKEARSDIDRRLQTTGHTLEWLAFSLSDEELRDPRMVKAVKYVTDILLNEDVSEWEIGHLGHALHALQIYNERVFGGPLRSFEGLVTKRPLKTAQRPTQER
ncbi:MAG: hypothetical protein K8U03_01445 [Planctomycetia bacterium]|nr:hypothetical protein [Planctomycetia bacterium]